MGTKIGSILPSAQTGWILQLEQTFRCPIRCRLQTSEWLRSASISSRRTGETPSRVSSWQDVCCPSL